MKKPWATPGARVGILGGSFDPPHAGHVHLTLEALKRLELDQIWWMVSPGNPIKAHAPAPLEQRVAASKLIMQHPRVRITALEADYGTVATVETLAALKEDYRKINFVWIMGADNLAGFHKWERWQDIMSHMPIAVLARPGQRLKALNSPAARRFAGARLPMRAARRLAFAEPPAWTYLDMPMRAVSSSQLRAEANAKRATRLRP